MLDVRQREHRRQRRLDDRHDADEVAALLAGEREVVDVEDREVGAAGDEQLDRVGRVRRRADVQLDAERGVVAARDRHVDAGVDGVGLEVQQQRRRAVRGVALAVPRRSAASASAAASRNAVMRGAAHVGDEHTAAAAAGAPRRPGPWALRGRLDCERCAGASPSAAT